MRIAPLLLGVLLAPQAAAQQTAVATERLQARVEAIAGGEGIEGRRAAIVAGLEQLGLEPVLLPFDPPPGRAPRQGINILAHLGGPAERVLMLGAHYDDVGMGQGVIDNAAGVAAVLELGAALLRLPLEHHGVTLAFFDLEENGLLGSRALAADSLRRPLPHVFLNVDVFGYGEALWVGAREPGDRFSGALGAAGERAELGVVVDSMYPPSDHLSFRRTSTRSYSVSLLDEADILLLVPMLGGGSFAGTEGPRIMRIIHTEEDTLEQFDAGAAARGIAAVEDGIRRFDAATGEPESGP
jgi:aminopeptidase S